MKGWRGFFWAFAAGMLTMSFVSYRVETRLEAKLVQERIECDDKLAELDTRAQDEAKAKFDLKTRYNGCAVSFGKLVQVVQAKCPLIKMVFN